MCLIGLLGGWCGVVGIMLTCGFDVGLYVLPVSCCVGFVLGMFMWIGDVLLGFGLSG